MRTVALADACSLITDGTHYTPPDIGAGVPFLTVKDVGPGGLDFHGCARIAQQEFEAADAGNSAPKYGDVLFSKDGTVGKVHVVQTTEPFAVLSSLAILRPKDHVDSRFLGRMLETPEVLGQAVKRKSGSAIRRIILTDLRKVEIPLPPIGEQRRIAAILDQADALRAKRRQVLAHLDTLTQAIFQGMFGTVRTNEHGLVEATIGDVAERVTDGEHKTPRRSDFGVPLLSARNIRDGWIDFENTDFVDQDEYAALSRRIEPREGDVLISCSGTIGRVAQVRGQQRFAMVRSAALVRPGPSVHPTFLEQLLSSPTLKAIMIAQANSSAQANLFQNQIRRLPMVLPSMERQREFAASVERVDARRAFAQRALAAQDELFASLQARAFRGEL